MSKEGWKNRKFNFSSQTPKLGEGAHSQGKHYGIFYEVGKQTLLENDKVQVSRKFLVIGFTIICKMDMYSYILFKENTSCCIKSIQVDLN